MKTLHETRLLRRLIGLIAVICCGPALDAEAEILAGTAFSIDIGSSARVLNAIGTPQYNDILMSESCDNPHLRVRKNNVPAIKVSVADTTTAGVQLTSFSLAINSDPYFFGTGDVATDSFTDFIRKTTYIDAGVTILGSTLSPDLQTLTVNFDGLTAGKSVIFNVDLDVVDDPSMFLFPDYRVVLNGAPVSAFDPPTAPATISGTFSDGLMELSQSKDLDQQTTVPAYFNEHLRPYHTMDTIPVVPEGLEPGMNDPVKINFEEVAVNEMTMLLQAAKIANTGDTGTLVDVYSYMFTGADAGLFKIKNRTEAPGEDLGIQLEGGSPTDMMATFDLTFMGAGSPGMYSANFVLKTSKGDMEFPMMAMVREVPEPSTALLTLAGVGVAAAWRRRR
ncbi:MAG: PEP-CTERM sorting domain-containing protein [Planctomycetales bacterium]|nr:PEP-CTERM sorting domain-containing protein [Planctomycetales bacterium]